MAIFVVLILFLFVIIFLFSSKKFSPIPYFPTQRADLEKIVEALDLKNNQTVIDLGAGDGIVIFKAAEQAINEGLNTEFVAVEINPVLVLILHLCRLFNSNRKNIRIIWGDMFKIRPKVILNEVKDLSLMRVVLYLYISPWFLEKVIKIFLPAFTGVDKQVGKLKIVSYMYPIKSLKKKQKIIRGKNSIFVYDL